jgi:glutamine synthetase
VRDTKPWPAVSSFAIDTAIASLTIVAEFEFYQFRAPQIDSSERNSSGTASFLKNNPVESLPPLTEGMFGYSITRPVHNQDYYYGIFDACEKFRCDIEGWHTESGPGVFEAVGA